jgi:hypothetical protein
MKPDDFEKQLQRQPLREVPAPWREEVLEAARRASASRASRLQSQACLGWREWLWPCPQAWAGLAALWMIILGLNATAPAGPGLTAKQSPAPPSETGPTLAAQRRELARLLDNVAEPAQAPKAPPGPRSEGFAPSKV